MNMPQWGLCVCAGEGGVGGRGAVLSIPHKPFYKHIIYRVSLDKENNDGFVLYVLEPVQGHVYWERYRSRLILWSSG